VRCHDVTPFRPSQLLRGAPYKGEMQEDGKAFYMDRGGKSNVESITGIKRLRMTNKSHVFHILKKGESNPGRKIHWRQQGIRKDPRVPEEEVLYTRKGASFSW